MSENVPFDLRAESHRQIGDVICTIATNHCQVDVDELTHQRICELMGWIREVDTLRDTHGLSIPQTMDYLVDPSSPLIGRYPALMSGVVEPHVFYGMAERTLSIFKLGKLAASALNSDDYFPVRIEEGAQAANLIEDVATKYVREQPAFQDSFMPLARAVAISATMFDSLIDAKMDYENGQLQFKPDIDFYKRAGALTVKYFRPAIPAAFHLPVARQLVPMSVTGIRNKLLYEEDGTHRFKSRTAAPEVN